MHERIGQAQKGALMSEQKFDTSVDVLVAGSGGAGFACGVTAASKGLKTIIVESTELIGGNTAKSGGGFWVPNNHLMKEAGQVDSFERARAYMDNVIEYDGPSSSPERRDAFVIEANNMVEYLESCGVEFHYSQGYPDYYPNDEFGTDYGRELEGVIYDVKRLPEEWRKKIRGGIALPMLNIDAARIQAPFTKRGRSALKEIVVDRMIGGKLHGKSNIGMGACLIAMLMEAFLKYGGEVWLESPITELIQDEDGRIVGAVVQTKEGAKRIEARRGVMLATGGYAKNQTMADEFHVQPYKAEWSVSSQGDQGDGIRIGMAVGGATELMEDAWMGPVVMDAKGISSFMIWERSDPYSIIVDKAGTRFMNESESYVDAGHHMYEHNKEIPCIPAYMVLDKKHRDKYMLAMMPPKMNQKGIFENGSMVKADTIEELAAKAGIDPEGLAATVEHFNRMAAKGIDEDFDRGGNAYDHMYSDPDHKPNPNLGPIDTPPYYCIKVWPGNLSTKGGLSTDVKGRVIHEDGHVIEGLYAAGNNSASVMGRTYPGPGATIAPAMAFGYAAACDMAEKE